MFGNNLSADFHKDAYNLKCQFIWENKIVKLENYLIIRKIGEYFMSNVVVIGTQWGDEGKVRIVDWLSEKAELVVRFQGGHNAGHTLVVDKKIFRVYYYQVELLEKIQLF